MGDLVDSEPDHPDPRSRYDALREACAVAREGDTWVVLRHAEVVRAATEPETFSSRVSARRAIPNSLDGAEHRAYRAVVDRYLTADRVAGLEPRCRVHAAGIVDALPRGTTVKTVGGIGVPYAVRVQSAWLGWPAELEPDLVAWMADNRAATRSGDRTRTAEVAERFDTMIRGLLEERRRPGRPSAPADVTEELMNDTVDGRPLTDEEIVSILRNWTAGDLGSLATSVGVIVHLLAARPEVQHEVRALVDAADRPAGRVAVEDALEEILRIDDPFVANRRVTTHPVELGGEQLPERAPVLLNWTAANRDPRVFGDPERYDPGANRAANLVFGTARTCVPGAR